MGADFYPQKDRLPCPSAFAHAVVSPEILFSVSSFYLGEEEDVFFNVKSKCHFPLKSPLIFPGRVASASTRSQTHAQNTIKTNGSPHWGFRNHLCAPVEQIQGMPWCLLHQMKKFSYLLSELHCLILKLLNMSAFVFTKLHSLWKPPPNIWQEAQQK